MAKLSDARILGGIGALILLIGGFGTAIPIAGFPLSLIGLILVFVAVKNISDITKDKNIFNFYLYNFIISIIAMVAVVAIFLIAIGSLGGLSYFSQFENLQGATDPAEVLNLISPLLGSCIAALVVGWVLLVLSSIYLRKSYDKIAEYTEVDMFKTTGFIYFIGALTAIILVGFIIILIARILEVISYFKIPDELPKVESQPEITK